MASRRGVLLGVFHRVLHVALPYFYIPNLTKQNQLSVAPAGKGKRVGCSLESCHLPIKHLNVAAGEGGMFLTTATRWCVCVCAHGRHLVVVKIGISRLFELEPKEELKDLICIKIQRKEKRSEMISDATSVRQSYKHKPFPTTCGNIVLAVYLILRVRIRFSI